MPCGGEGGRGGDQPMFQAVQPLWSTGDTPVPSNVGI